MPYLMPGPSLCTVLWTGGLWVLIYDVVIRKCPQHMNIWGRMRLPAILLMYHASTRTKTHINFTGLIFSLIFSIQELQCSIPMIWNSLVYCQGTKNMIKRLYYFLYLPCYCVSNKSWRMLYSKLLYEMG